MKKFIIAVGFIILAVFLLNTFINNETSSMKSEGRRIGNASITNLNNVERAPTPAP